MRTFSHFLLTAVGQDQLKKRGVRVHVSAVLLGSVLPDLPIFLLMSSYFVYYRWLNPIAEAEMVRLLHEELYFTDPVWIVGHNLFHSPLLILLVLALGYWGLRTGRRWGPALFWYAIGSGFHTLVDIFTHHTDGPLLLFPLDWELRFNSPISYWDADYYGGIVTAVEYALDLLILLYFLVRWLHGHQRTKMAQPCEKEQVS